MRKGCIRAFICLRHVLCNKLGQRFGEALQKACGGPNLTESLTWFDRKVKPSYASKMFESHRIANSEEVRNLFFVHAMQSQRCAAEHVNMYHFERKRMPYAESGFNDFSHDSNQKGEKVLR